MHLVLNNQIAYTKTMMMFLCCSRYMAPEYAMEGRFSEKSDVYSLGVLVLEIIKGKRNTHYYNHQHSLSLIGCVSLVVTICLDHQND